MATTAQLDLIAVISRLSAQISAQGKYHVFFRYSGHVDVVDVEVHPSDDPYSDASPSKFVAGLGSHENWLLLEHENGELAALHKKLGDLLDVDADGVPV